MSNSNILTTEDLKAATGYDRSADIERCLRNNGIRVFSGRKGPWTMRDIVNAAGGIVSGIKQDNESIL